MRLPHKLTPCTGDHLMRSSYIMTLVQVISHNNSYNRVTPGIVDHDTKDHLNIVNPVTR